MSHIKIIASLLLLFFSFNARAVCTLIEKNVELRKYSFKCNGETVNIQCEIKNKNICTVNIKEKLKSMKFDINDDQFNALNLFSSSTQEKAECDASKKLCKINKNVCEKYKKDFSAAKKGYSESIRSKGHCDTILGKSVQTVGLFSNEFIEESEFSKNSCNKASDQAVVAIKNKISVFEHNMNLSFTHPESLLGRCVGRKHGDTFSDIGEMIKLKQPTLDKFKKIIIGKMYSSDWISGLACLEGFDGFYENGKLEIDKVMCTIVEESILELDDKNVMCNLGTGVGTDRFTDANTADRAGFGVAKADIVPIEQKPMPEAMASQIGKPIGLAPALAQVDQAVPGSGTAAGVTPSEGTIAAGAVRNTIPTAAAFQAGQAFAPVYQKLSNIANSVPTSGRVGVIGGGGSLGKLSAATGVVSVTRKTPTTNSDTTLNPDALIAASGTSAVAAGIIAQKSGATDSGTAGKPSLQRSTASDSSGPIGGGPRSLGLSGGGGSGGSGSAAGVAEGASNTEAFNSADIASAQKKVTQLNSPAQINSFFKEEAGNLRGLIYSDEKLSKLLASKGIRVMNQSGDVAGESMAKAKYVFRDDGSKFTALKVAKK